MSQIAKQGFWGTVVTYLGVLIGFITTFFVLTRLLRTEDIGLVRVLIDTATLFIGLAQLGTTSSTIRFFPYFKTDDNKHHGFFFYTLLLPLVGFIIFGIAYFLASDSLKNIFAEKSPLVVDYYYIVLPIAFFMLYQTVFETNAATLRHTVFPRFVREVLTRLCLLVAYILYAYKTVNLDGFVWIRCLTYAIAALANFCYLIIKEKIYWKPDLEFLSKPLLKQVGSYTLFVLLTALASVVAPTLSSFFLTAQLGLNYTGVFAIATYMAVMVSIPYRSVNAIAQPQLATAIKEQNHTDAQTLLQQVARNLLLAGMSILLIIWINIDLIYLILPNGETYSAARTAVLLLGLSQLVLAAFTIALSALNYSPYYKYSLVYAVLLTIASLWLNNILIPKYEMNGAALANLLAYLLYFGIISLTLYLKTKLNIISKKMLGIILVSILFFALNELLLKLFVLSIPLSAIIRDLILLPLFILIVYKLHLAPELEQTINRYINSKQTKQ